MAETIEIVRSILTTAGITNVYAGSHPQDQAVPFVIIEQNQSVAINDFEDQSGQHRTYTIESVHSEGLLAWALAKSVFAALHNADGLSSDIRYQAWMTAEQETALEIGGREVPYTVITQDWVVYTSE